MIMVCMLLWISYFSFFEAFADEKANFSAKDSWTPTKIYFPDDFKSTIDETSKQTHRVNYNPYINSKNEKTPVDGEMNLKRVPRLAVPFVGRSAELHLPLSQTQSILDPYGDYNVEFDSKALDYSEIGAALSPLQDSFQSKRLYYMSPGLNKEAQNGEAVNFVHSEQFNSFSDSNCPLPVTKYVTDARVDYITHYKTVQNTKVEHVPVTEYSNIPIYTTSYLTEYHTQYHTTTEYDYDTVYLTSTIYHTNDHTSYQTITSHYTITSVVYTTVVTPVYHTTTSYHTLYNTQTQTKNHHHTSVVYQSVYQTKTAYYTQFVTKTMPSPVYLTKTVQKYQTVTKPQYFTSYTTRDEMKKHF